MSTAPKTQGKAMYVASSSDRDWLLSEQRKLYARSYEQTEYVFCKLWGLVTDPRNLRVAFARVARNRGRRTAGVDGMTVRSILDRDSVDGFVDRVREELRSGEFQPSPVRRVLIPKPGQPGKFRPLGIPTVKDRVVQAAVKNILEPVFEADFFPCSYGFRPGRGAHAALEQLRKLLFLKRTERHVKVCPRLPYKWAIEGDIKGCFDNIDHHGLMERVRRRVGDAKVNRLLVAFLKAGVMHQGVTLGVHTGTPQGGILSPLLANIALGVIDERYERYVWPRRSPTPLLDEKDIQRRARNNREDDRRHRRLARTVKFPVRYADDFIILIDTRTEPDEGQSRQVALDEKATLAGILKETLDLELSEAKTLVTSVTQPMRFLGHHVRVQRHPVYGWVSKCVIPKDRSARLRYMIKQHFARGTHAASLESRLDLLNPLLRGWSAYYRHAWGAKRIFASLDHYVRQKIRKWIQAKHRGASMRVLYRRYGWRKPSGRMWRWRDGDAVLFEMASRRVERYRHGWMKTPDFASTSMESPVQNESCTPGSEGGAQKPAGASRKRR